MKYWVYKCNARNEPHQNHFGDWTDFFIGRIERRWGTTEFVPQLAIVNTGDMILAYQTDRNELVGLARVERLEQRGEFLDLIVSPIERIGVRVRPLKVADPLIAQIPALQPGPIRTLYDIDTVDAERLIAAAMATLKTQKQSP